MCTTILFAGSALGLSGVPGHKTALQAPSSVLGPFFHAFFWKNTFSTPKETFLMLYNSNDIWNM